MMIVHDNFQLNINTTLEPLPLSVARAIHAQCSTCALRSRFSSRSGNDEKRAVERISLTAGAMGFIVYLV